MGFRPTTLSKSRFKLAVECPTKVFYRLDKHYVNSKDADEFLHAGVAESEQRLAQLQSTYESDLHTARVACAR
jgi:hypothetical protein